MATMTSKEVAVLYETITGQCQKRGVITTDEPFDLDAFLAAHPGLAAVIIPRDELPGPDQNERHFRQAVADHTGTSYFEHGADRAVMVHPAGHVVSVHHGNVPGLDRPDDGHRLVSHRTAEVGDHIP